MKIFSQPVNNYAPLD